MITTTATINVLKNEFWDKRGDYEWTKGMVHHSTRENGISIKYSIHYIETKVGSLMVVWITLRGTVDWKNWVANATCTLVPSAYAGSEGTKVHGGFHISYNSIRNQLLRDISSLEKKVYSITIVGHSLGGALAANSAFDILHNGSAYGNPRKVELITFGAPAVGNQAFVDRFHQLTATKTGSLPPYCFVNHFDPVPYSINFKKDVVAVQVNSQMGKTFLISQDEVFNRIPLLS